MLTRALFNDGPQVSVLGLRLAAPPMAPWPRFGEQCLYEVKRLSEEPAFALVRAALAGGMTLIDSDWASGNGHAEEIIGRALRNQGRRPFVSTRGGPRFDFSGRLIHDNSRSNLMNQCEDSRQRLGVASVDIYSVDGLDESVELKLTARGLGDLAHNGRTRFVGAANLPLPALQEIVRHADIKVVQTPANLLLRSDISAIGAFCREKAMGLVVSDPMAHGLLAGVFSGRESFPEIDPERGGTLFKQPNFARAVAFAARLEELARSMGLSREILCIAWVLAQPGVVSVLLEPRDEQELQRWLPAGDVELSAHQLRAAEELAAKCGF